MSRFVVLFCLLLVSGFSRGEVDPGDGGKPLVVASIQPLTLMANDLAGDWLRVETLLAAGQEPHHLALSISQRRKLDNADLVLWVGPALESFLVKILRDVDSARHLSFQDTFDGGAVTISANDPHYWLHPQLAAAFYRALGDKLGERFPEKSGQIQARLQVVLAELDETSKAIQSTISAAQEGKVIVDHQAYSYFVLQYQIPITGALTDESGVAAGPRTIAGFLSQSDVSCVVVERLPAPKRAQKLASSLRVPLIAIDPLGTEVSLTEGFAGLLSRVGDGFAECFQATAGSGGTSAR